MTFMSDSFRSAHPRLTAALLALPLCAAMAAPAAAASFFSFEVRATFSGVVIGSETVDQEFVLSGRTTPTAPFGWNGSAVELTLDMSSLSLSYAGSPIGASSFGLFTYGVLGGEFAPNNPATFRFTDTGGGIDFRPVTALDSLLFAMQFDGIETRVGFGGSAAGAIGEGPTGQGAARFSITTATTASGAADFTDGILLQRLDPDVNSRTATYTPIPLPAAGWLLLTALGGLSALRRRRAAG